MGCVNSVLRCMLNLENYSLAGCTRNHLVMNTGHLCHWQWVKTKPPAPIPLIVGIIINLLQVIFVDTYYYSRCISSLGHKWRNSVLSFGPFWSLFPPFFLSCCCVFVVVVVFSAWHVWVTFPKVEDHDKSKSTSYKQYQPECLALFDQT